MCELGRGGGRATGRVPSRYGRRLRDVLKIELRIGHVAYSDHQALAQRKTRIKAIRRARR